MPLSFSEQKKILQKKNPSDLTPFKLHSEEIDENNFVTVITPKFRNKLLQKFILPKMKNKHFKIELDKFGSFIWLNINGKNSAADIINISSQHFGDEINPADERVGIFLYQLFENKLISFSEVNQ